MSLGADFLADHAYEIHNGWEPGIYIGGSYNEQTNNHPERKKTMPSIPMPKVPARPAPKAPTAPVKKTVSFGKIATKKRGQYIILAGQGGTGKSTACLMKPGETAFVNLEGSAEILNGRMQSIAPERLDHIHVVDFEFTDDPAADYDTLCATLEANGYDGMDTIVIDSWTVVQKLMKAYVFAHEQYKGKVCSSTEDYGYSTFPIYAFKHYTRLQNALLSHIRAGRDVVIIAHAVDETIPDAALNDMKQWQFDAFMMKSGKESIRHDMFNAADQVWFLSNGTLAADKTKKAVAGSRMVYLVGTGVIWAKSRTYSGDPAVLVPDGESIPWDVLNF